MTEEQIQQALKKQTYVEFMAYLCEEVGGGELPLLASFDVRVAQHLNNLSKTIK